MGNDLSTQSQQTPPGTEVDIDNQPTSPENHSVILQHQLIQHPLDVEDAQNAVPHVGLAEELDLNADNRAAQQARARLDLATEQITEAHEAFKQRHTEYVRDIQEYSHMCSRTEIDIHHFQRGAELTKAFRDAEEEWERARAHAKSLGLLANYAGQEFDFVDEDDDGYRESHDPASNTHSVDRDAIEAWMANVEDFPGDGDGNSETPSTEYDGESVNISDAGSAVNTCRGWRKAIDGWHATQEALRLELESRRT